jgi:nicotinic acid phosphoribosyltransferase
MDALVPLDGISDADVGLDLHDRRLDVCMFVDATSNDEAVRMGIAAVGTAVHATGGHTPEWERALEADAFTTRAARADLLPT